MSRQPESGNLLDDVEQLPDDDGDRGYDLQQKAIQQEQPVPSKSVASTVAIHPVSSPEHPSEKTNESESEPSSSPDAPALQRHDGDVWSPGFWKQFPYRAALALLSCLAFIIASIVVLVKSDDQPTSAWTVSPTVYLALFMSGTNMLARFAFSEGVKIAWWCKALRGGTITDLHNHWDHADGILPALFSGRQFSLVALGTIAVTVMVIDQPLIQRASSVITIPRTFPVNVTAPIAPEVPWGFTGYQIGRRTTDQVMTQHMISAFNDHNSQAPIFTGFSGCNDTCTGYVDAGGLSAKCNTTSGPIMYNMYDYLGKTVSPFSVNFGLKPSRVNASSQMVLNVAYTDNSDGSSCSGIRTERTCYLVPATLRYPVKLTGNILTIGDILGNGTTQSFQPTPPMIGVDGGGDFSTWTLGGMYIAANSLFSANATYIFGGGNGIYMALPDTLSNQFINFAPQNLSGLEDSQKITVPSACGSNWTDPTSYILSSLNMMAFRISLPAAGFPFRNTSSPPAPQFLVMEQASNFNVHRSDYRFLIASTLLTTVFVVLITPMFIGWWELGRDVTLNPMETAKAFDAPLLRGPGSNAPLPELLKSMATRRVRFGEVESYAAGPMVSRQLKLADPVEVTTPRSGVAYA
ncbi:uncharacterized protein BP5553_00400 [Venustampulla echinocandica]|uniref:Uncharacterized protein n=1 Tax=Venustampulla echinocandica TaxID=2656787 RepID=A0A370TY31_9HELO|nr:uncharacterized protein BP5553_00400 [Venustampulla echinocandica]RDL40421.1 hypothetical protein BP5553_00400 [Venustampulla echinocandica]